MKSAQQLSPDSKRVLGAIRKHGMLLLNDARLPNLCRLVAGETVPGSWWAHPRAQAIFKVYDGLDEHPDVLIAKLVSGKVTYVDRNLWPHIVAIGRGREPWQMDDLSAEAHKLLAAVDRAPVEPRREVSKAVSELEGRMLVFSAQFHSPSGAHVRRLESWDHWSGRIGAPQHVTTAAVGRAALEKVMTNLNRQFDGRGRLPWQAQGVIGAIFV